MFERILVPLDGSPRAEVILPLIGRILRREDSEILLLRVVDIPSSIGRVSFAILQQKECEEAQKYLHDLILRFGEKAEKIHARVAEGWAADVILETARTEGATLIAMTTHGRSGLARWAFGSVAEKVARASDVPLLLVRSFRRAPKGDLEPMVPEEMPFKRILVAIDGSPTSLAAVEPARKFAQLYGSDVLVLHVENPPVPTGAILPGMEVPLPDMTATPTPSGLDDITKKAAARFEQAGLQATRLTTLGDPAAEILDLSVNRGMDLIALGTHGRSGIARWALGSVAERVLRSGEVPLLLVRMPKSQEKVKTPSRTKEHARG